MSQSNFGTDTLNYENGSHYMGEISESLDRYGEGLQTFISGEVNKGTHKANKRHGYCKKKFFPDLSNRLCKFPERTDHHRRIQRG